MVALIVYGLCQIAFRLNIEYPLSQQESILPVSFSEGSEGAKHDQKATARFI